MAARFLGVPPWELLEQPLVWTELALSIESCMNWAEREMMKRARN
jgi:hypothetical protein